MIRQLRMLQLHLAKVDSSTTLDYKLSDLHLVSRLYKWVCNLVRCSLVYLMVLYLQRFGTSSVPTFTIGAALFRGDWEQAVNLILQPRDGDIL